MWVWDDGGCEAAEGEGRGGGAVAVHERGRVRCVLQGEVLGQEYMFEESRYGDNNGRVPGLPH